MERVGQASGSRHKWRARPTMLPDLGIARIRNHPWMERCQLIEFSDGRWGGINDEGSSPYKFWERPHETLEQYIALAKGLPWPPKKKRVLRVPPKQGKRVRV